jgi:hypothetical protein
MHCHAYRDRTLPEIELCNSYPFVENYVSNCAIISGQCKIFKNMLVP